jgi:hypothetical protein
MVRPSNPVFDAVAAREVGAWTTHDFASHDDARAFQQNIHAAMKRRGIRISTNVVGNRCHVRIDSKEQQV